jgi:LysM repeat protein
LTRPTSVAIGLSAAAAAFSLTIVNSLGGVASAAVAQPSSAAPSASLTTLRIAIQPAWFLSSISKHVAKAPVHATRAKTYRVKAGDSLWAIAKQQHVDWFNLAADNSMQMYDTLMVGRVLNLPKPGEAPHAAMPLQNPAAAVVAAQTAPATSTSTVSQPTVSQPTVTQPTVTQPTVTQPTVTQPAVASSSSVSTGGMSSFESCVISRESGGNPQVTNASGHYGLFQFSESTWVAYGGNPADFGNASAAEQEQVFNNAMARGGEGNWAPYDGC